MVRFFMAIKGALMKLKPFLITAAIGAQGVILTTTLFFLNHTKDISEDLFDDEKEISEEIVSLDSRPSSKVPFQNYITTDGKVFCSNYVKIKAKKEGIVEDLFVKDGDSVTKGDVLLTLEQGMLPFVLKEKIADYETAVAEYKVIECQVEENSRVEQKDVMKAMIRKREASMETLEKALKDCTVVSPIDGRVLKTVAQTGEFLSVKDEAIIIGVDTPLHLKTLIPEREMWRLNASKNLRAVAYHKTNPHIHFILDFVTVKPNAIEGKDKESLIEVVFSFDKGKAPIYLDQSLDVYIEATNVKDAAYFEYQFNKN